jgi:hypothetical protein
MEIARGSIITANLYSYILGQVLSTLERQNTENSKQIFPDETAGPQSQIPTFMFL